MLKIGEKSIWLVKFNAADVSQCTCGISGLEMCHAMIIQGNICSLYCWGAVAVTCAHIACSVGIYYDKRERVLITCCNIWPIVTQLISDYFQPKMLEVCGRCLPSGPLL